MIHSGWHFTDILIDSALKQLRFSKRTLASTKHSQNSSLHYVAERGGKVLPHMVIKLNFTLRMIITPGCNYQSNRQSCKQGFKRWDLLSILKPNFDTFLVAKRRNDRHWREMVRAGQGTLTSRLYTPPTPSKKKKEKFKVFQCHFFFSERATWEAYVDRCVPPLQREKNASFPRRRRCSRPLNATPNSPSFCFLYNFLPWSAPASEVCPLRGNRVPRVT